MSSDGTRNRRTALLHSLHSRSSGTVLQNDAQLGELGVQLKELGNESLLRGQHCHVTSRRTFSVQIQNHILSFHFLENGVELRVVDHAGRGVGRHTSWVTLDTNNAALLGFNDGLRGHGLVQIQRHKEVDIRLKGLEALLVVQSTVDGRDRWHKVGLLSVLDIALKTGFVSPIKKFPFTITKTVFTPPCRIVGVTKSIIGPSRRWTIFGQPASINFPELLSTMEVGRGGEFYSLQLRERHDEFQIKTKL
jgi:hypothetical protein